MKEMFNKMTIEEKLEFLEAYAKVSDGLVKKLDIEAKAQNDQAKLAEQDDGFVYETFTMEHRMGPSCCWAITTTTKKRNKNGDLVGKKVVSEPYPGMGEFPPSTTYYDADDNVVDEMP